MRSDWGVQVERVIPCWQRNAMSYNRPSCDQVPLFTFNDKQNYVEFNQPVEIIQLDGRLLHETNGFFVYIYGLYQIEYTMLILRCWFTPLFQQRCQAL